MINIQLRHVCLASLAILFSSPFAMATPVDSAAVNNSIETQASVVNTRVEHAADWDVSESEYQHYKSLMFGPDGKWYPQLTPAEVLGMYADNPQDEKHFAEIAAKEEHEKITRELKFNNAFHEAIHNLYAEKPIIKNVDISAFNPIKNNKSFVSDESVILQPNDHLAVFVDTALGLDFLVMPTLLSLINTHPGVYLDIYCAENITDTELKVWAKNNNLPIELVNKGIITLNHDQNKSKSIFVSGALPQVILIRQGHSQSVRLATLR